MNNFNLSDEIIKLSNQYFQENFKSNTFVPYISQIPVSGKVLDEKDLEYLIKSSLDLWLTGGEFTVTNWLLNLLKSIWGGSPESIG